MAEVAWFVQPREEEPEGRPHAMGVFPPFPVLLFAKKVLKSPTS